MNTNLLIAIVMLACLTTWGIFHATSKGDEHPVDKVCSLITLLIASGCGLYLAITNLGDK